MAIRGVPARRPIRTLLAGLGILVVGGTAVVACGGGGGGLGQQAIAKASEGTWDCGSEGEEPTDRIVAGDGSFEIRPLDDGDDPDDRQQGTWEVSGKTVSLSVGTADDKGVLEIRGFDDVDFQVAEIEVRNPDDPDETAKLKVSVEADDRIRVDPADGAGDEFPTLPWTCRRQ